MGLKLCVLLIFLYRWLKRFQGTSTDGRSCLIGQIPAKRFLPQVSSRDIVAGLFSNTFYTACSKRFLDLSYHAVVCLVEAHPTQSSKIHLPPVLSSAFLVVYRLGGAGPRGQAL